MDWQRYVNVRGKKLSVLIAEPPRQSQSMPTLPLTPSNNISAVFAVTQCPSVRPSVMFMDHVKTNKHIFEIFSPSGTHHSSFSMSNGIAIFRRESPPLTGASNAGGLGRNRDSGPIFGLTACVNAATGQVLSTRSPVDHGHRLASYDTSLVSPHTGALNIGGVYKFRDFLSISRYISRTVQYIAIVTMEGE